MCIVISARGMAAMITSLGGRVSVRRTLQMRKKVSYMIKRMLAEALKIPYT